MGRGMDEGLHRDGVRQSEAARGHFPLLLSAQDNRGSHSSRSSVMRETSVRRGTPATVPPAAAMNGQQRCKANGIELFNFYPGSE